ncbi:MAG TPA: DegT/DnrJ/EryC1/StrS family aminotransferase [Vicinamibacterales bacterium]|nr:DegT/DnrJ/EryC1/StrS family aminotransferase [Vicinamibacterales bacterium]
MIRRQTFLPFALPELGDAELEEVKSVLESGWITTGPKTQQFEAEFAAYVGAKHAVAVNSCTAAMHLSLEATGVQPGDFVLTTPYTFAATAEVVRYFDAIPVFVDVERDTLNMHPQALVQTFDDLANSLGGARPSMPAVARAMARATDKTSGRRPVSGPGRIQAVIPVHIAGHPCESDALAAFARTHQLAIIEDAAHACSATYKGRPIGSATPGVRGTTCFSFYATKTLATGEGGMMTTDADDCAERVRMMSLHGISKDAWKRYTASGSWYYEIIAPGYKYNMSDLAAAIGLAQLRKVDAMRQRRADIAARYSEAFRRYDELEAPTVRPHVGHAWHLYTLRLNAGLSISRDEFIEYLKDAHIGTSVHFIPLHIHPYYEAAFGYRPEDLPVAFQEYQREISLPIYSKMSDADVRSVIDAVSNVVEQFRATRRYAVAGH